MSARLRPFDPTDILLALMLHSPWHVVRTDTGFWFGRYFVRIDASHPLMRSIG